MVSSTRRKSVSFVEPADAPASRTRRNGILAAANSPSAKSPAKSALKRPARAAPGSVEADGAFKFKRRKNPHAGAADRPAESSRPLEPALPQSPPVAPTLLEPTLSGASPEMLHALWDVCHEPGADGPLASACLAELTRLGMHAAPPADPNARLRVKEDLLRRRLVELTAAAEEWDAAAEAGALIRTAEIEMDDADGALAMVDLPPPPPLDAQVCALRLHLALCADQVELSMLATDRLCGRSKEAQKRMAKATHQQTFQGYLDVQHPRLLIRSVATR